jgi:thioredoxin reductase
MADHEVDVLVVGGGPAGLSAATALAAAGVGRVEVVDREKALGGIPRHSHHTGYGVRDLHRLMTGPRYAAALVERAAAAGATLHAGVTVTSLDVSGHPAVRTTSRDGLETVTAGAVVLATGARERPRAARLVPGTRPAGIYTTGQLQQAVYEFGQPVGSRAVVVGAEHVSYSAVTTLAHAGAEVAAMVTEHERSQTYLAFRAGAALRYRLPVLTGVRVGRILGTGRVSGVELVDATGRTTQVECDTVVFTGDWVPDHELARRMGASLDAGTRGPAVDTGLRTTAPGVFAVGNLVHPVLTADQAALVARHAASVVLEWLRAPARTKWGHGVPVEVAAPLRWVSPNLLAPGQPAPVRGSFVLWPAEFCRRPCLEIRQAGGVLHRERRWRTLVPQRPYGLSATWIDRVDPTAGPVTVSVAAEG